MIFTQKVLGVLSVSIFEVDLNFRVFESSWLDSEYFKKNTCLRSESRCLVKKKTNFYVN